MPKRHSPDRLYPTIFSTYCAYSNVYITSCEKPIVVPTTKFVATVAFKSWLSIWTTTAIIMLLLRKILLSGIAWTEPRNNNNKIMIGTGLLMELIAQHETAATLATMSRTGNSSIISWRVLCTNEQILLL
jgi:hypothetical protein